MPEINRPGSLAGGTSLIMALLAFVLGSAPFTPAMVLAVFSIPLALISVLYGAWRQAAIAAWFTIAAWLVVPIARSTSIRIDYLLLAFGLAGLLLAACLLYGYLRTSGHLNS